MWSECEEGVATNIYDVPEGIYGGSLIKEGV